MFINNSMEFTRFTDCEATAYKRQMTSFVLYNTTTENLFTMIN